MPKTILLDGTVCCFSYQIKCVCRWHIFCCLLFSLYGVYFGHFGPLILEARCIAMMTICDFFFLHGNIAVSALSWPLLLCVVKGESTRFIQGTHTSTNCECDFKNRVSPQKSLSTGWKLQARIAVQ